MSDFEKGQIAMLHQLHWSTRRIASEVKRNQSTIVRFLKKYRDTGSYRRKSGSGRPRIFSEADEKRIIKLARKNRYVTSGEIILKLKLTSNVTERTVRNVIQKYGGKSVFTKKKPFISERNRIRRVAWARVHVKWTLRKWKKVLFSDESPFTLRYNGRVRVWKFNNDDPYDIRLLRGTIKHDKKINIWGCFSWYGVGDIYRVRGNMNAKQYHSILVHHMVPSAQRLFGDDFLDKFVYQQDNDPKHTARIIKRYFENKCITVLDWPSQSPDINPIENLWAIFDSNFKNRKVSNEDELYAFLKNEWSKISLKTLRDLIKSMPRRCQAVIDANGYPTKY